MHESIRIVPTSHGPKAYIPSDVAWDLVEYLSNQRVPATYSYEEFHVIVSFGYMDLQAVCALLDKWVHVENELDSHMGKTRLDLLVATPA